MATYWIGYEWQTNVISHIALEVSEYNQSLETGVLTT